MATKTIKNPTEKIQVYYVEENPIELRPGEEYTYEEKEPESVGISVAENLKISPSMGPNDPRKSRQQAMKPKPDQGGTA